MADPGDPFLRQLAWLVDRAGGKEALVRATGNKVGLRTLDSWSRGGYPRTSVTGAVRELDAWATSQDIGYPGAAGAPRLVASCGPARDRPAPIPAPTPTPAVRVRWWRWALLAGAQVVVVATTVAVTLAVTTDDAAPAPEGPATLLGVLPTVGDGRVYEQTAEAGPVVTYGDPRGLTAGGPALQTDQRVDARCRYFAPAPDASREAGWWYLLDSGVWAGLWAPTEAFTTRDEPSRLAGYDYRVPECRSALATQPAD